MNSLYFSKDLLQDILTFISKGLSDRQIEPIQVIMDREWKNDSRYVSYNTMSEIMVLAGKVSGDEHLGLHIGEQIMLKGKEMVDRIMDSSPSLDEAFQNAAYYSRLISDALDSQLIKEEKKYSVLFDPNPVWMTQPSYAIKQIVDLTLVCAFLSLRRLTGKNYNPLRLNFNYPKPQKVNEYYRIFNCTVQFNQEFPSIEFERHIFNQQTLEANSGLLPELKERAEKELQKLQIEEPILKELKRLIIRKKPARLHVGKAAEQLNMSKRSLQRKLQSENTSFKSVDKDITLKIACNYLTDSNKCLDEISYLLGFSECSSFIRFFKSGMQKTPKQYRSGVDK